VVGQGSLDWPGIISALHRSGYDGYLSLEYEYRWHPDDLPAPRDGLMASAQHLRLILDRLDGAGR
jgi:sugar phosphate isomerase/epimerase